MDEKSKLKKVNFDFFQVWKNHDGQEEVFDFDDWCELINNDKKRMDDRNIGYNGDIIRCNRIYVANDDQNPVTILHFLRMRRGTTPAVANLNLPKLSDVNLDANEYIAEDASALFDSTNYVLMLQKNIFSLSVKALQQYVNYFWNEGKADKEKEEIEFRPILRKDSYKRSKKVNKINSFSFKTANVIEPHKSRFKTGIQNIIDSTKEYGGVSVEIKISTTRSKTSVLNSDEVHNSVDEIMNSRELFKKAVVVSGDNGHSEPIELLKEKLSCTREYTIPIKAFLDPEVVEQDMIREYSPNYNNYKRMVDDNLKIR